MLSYFHKKYIQYRIKSRIWTGTKTDQRWLDMAFKYHLPLEWMVSIKGSEQKQNLFDWAFERFPDLHSNLWDTLVETLAHLPTTDEEKWQFWKTKSMYWIKTGQWKQMNQWWDRCPTKNWNVRIDFLYAMQNMILKNMLHSQNGESRFYTPIYLKNLYHLFENASPKKHSWIVSCIFDAFPKVCDLYEQAWQERQRIFPLEQRQDKEIQRGRFLGETFAKILAPFIEDEKSFIQGIGIYCLDYSQKANQIFRDSDLVQSAIASFTYEIWYKLKEKPYYQNRLCMLYLEKQLQTAQLLSDFPNSKDQPFFNLFELFEKDFSFYGQNPQQREKMILQSHLKPSEKKTVKPRI